MIDASLLAKLKHTADDLMKYRFPIWHYGDSVGFEGLLAASDLLADDQYWNWVYGALKGWSARARPFREIDNTVAGHVLCIVIERTGDDRMLSAATDLVDFLARRRQIRGVFASFERAPLRAPYGGAALTAREVMLLEDPGAGLFVDCIHFDPPFFAHLARLTGEESLAQLAVQQALGYIEVLQDDSGLFWHFWLERTGQRYGFGWGRGQGWALLGLLDLVTLLPAEQPGSERIRNACRRLLEALLPLQRPDGSWGSVVSEASAGPDASTAAFATVGLLRAAEVGLVDSSFREHALRAWSATAASVDERGVLTPVSAALWASTAPLHYLCAPIGFVVPWGQGPLLMAASEVKRNHA